MGFRHAEGGLAGLACCVLLALAPGEAWAQTTTAKIVYCCDVGGQPVCSDILPAACYGRAYRELSPTGIVRRIVAAPLTEVEIAERAAAERKRRAEEADRLRQSRLDQALLETYRSIEDLDGRRERELRDLDRSIGVLRAREAELIEHQRKLIDEATNTDNSEVAARLETDIRLLDSEIVAQSSVVAAKLRERNAVVERFEEHRRRYVELTTAAESEGSETASRRR